MAFTKGKMVFKGDNAKKLSTEKSPKAAKAKMIALHKEHNPLKKNRGAVAKKRAASAAKPTRKPASKARRKPARRKPAKRKR